MAKKSVVERNKKRIALSAKHRDKRLELKKVIYDKNISLDLRFQAQLKLNSLPRDASPSRIRNRCLITGRGRGCYRKFQMSRISLRSLANQGMLPGVVKASW